MKFTHTKRSALALAAVALFCALAWLGISWLTPLIGTTGVFVAIGVLFVVSRLAEGFVKDLNARDDERMRPLREELFGKDDTK